MKTAILALALLLSLISFGVRGQGAATSASAQDYPNRPLRAVVPNVPGGGTDTISRIVAAGLSEALGKQVVVDNRAGAGGSLAGSIVVNATPDGYTVLMGTISTQSINPVLLNLPYDPVKDFAPISMMGTTPNVLVVNLSLPVASVSEFVAYAKANPGKISYGSTGVGGSPHLAMELLKAMTGINIVHVPYKGAGAMLPDLLSGQIQAANVALSGQLPHIRAGRLRALAVTSAKRSAKLPDVPTVIESGIPGYEVIIWYAMFMPAAVPKATVAKLNAKLVKVLNAPDMKARLAQNGIDAAPSTPGELAAFVKAEIAKWSKVVKLTGIKKTN
ncbi:MAG: tripartite tricarboxylate transporter substrate binding protein [Betaproteobacteria bacterium]|nr:tripartite tricarboxylate transporter substrate binding protein [Betaproteobacteria bacterium]